MYWNRVIAGDVIAHHIKPIGEGRGPALTLGSIRGGLKQHGVLIAADYWMRSMS